MNSVSNNQIFQDSTILNSLRQVSKRANEEFPRDRVWEHFARAMGLPLQEGIPVYQQVNRAIKNINSELLRRLRVTQDKEEKALTYGLIQEKIEEIRSTSPTCNQIINRQELLMRTAFDDGSNFVNDDDVAATQHKHSANEEWVDFRGVYLQKNIELFDHLIGDYKVDKLQKINLSNNSLKTVPEHLYKSRHCIQKLDLSNNQIKKLPEWFREMDKLEYLFLNDNLFEEIPQEMPYGCQAFLEGNPVFEDGSTASQPPKRIKLDEEASGY